MKPNGGIVNLVEVDFKPSSGKAIAGSLSYRSLGLPLDSFRGLLSPGECAQLVDSLGSFIWEPVGIHGMKADYSPGDPVGSTRASFFSKPLADALWERLSPNLPAVRSFTVESETDWDGTSRWRPVSVSDLFRAIRYRDGGKLVAHYDAPYVISDSQRTLQSVLVYLDSDGNLSGAHTRFVRDPQKKTPISKRNLADWDRVANFDEVILGLRPAPGTGLVFDHRVLHDGEPASGSGVKTVLRTDIIFERVNQ